jgi:hypothetical protein
MLKYNGDHIHGLNWVLANKVNIFKLYYNKDLINYGKKAYFLTFFEIIRVSAVR